MDEKHERSLRHKAILLTLRGVRCGEILQCISRSSSWLHKWQKRFARFGWPGLHSQAHRPHRLAGRYATRTPATRRAGTPATGQTQSRVDWTKGHPTRVADSEPPPPGAFDF